MPNANAWPGTGGPSMPVLPVRAVEGTCDISSWIRLQCANYQTAIGTGNVSASFIVNMYASFYAWGQSLAAYQAVPNVTAFAQTQLGTGFDIAGSFGNMQTALANATAWILANFPSSGALTVGTQGQIIYENFSSASLAPLTALITTLQATVN